MLIPHNVLSKSNTGLTREMAKLVLSSAPRLAWDELKKIKANADSPILNDESLFDELSPDARSHFVMESYFPSRLVDSTVAWMFDVETIEEIDAEAAKRHANSFQLHVERGHDVRGFSDKLSDGNLSKELHQRLLGAFIAAADKDDTSNGKLMKYINNLLSHKHTTITQYLATNGKKGIYYDISPDVGVEFADAYLDLSLRDNIGFWSDPEQLHSKRCIIEGARVALGLKNVSWEKRREVINVMGLEGFDLEEIDLLCGGKIPDDIFAHIQAKGMITDNMPESCIGLVMDERVPLKKALRLAEDNPSKFAIACLSRGDIDNGARELVVSKMIDLANSFDAGRSKHGIDALSIAIGLGLVAYDEVADKVKDYADIIFSKAELRWAQKNNIELPVERQDRLLEFGIMSIEQGQCHHDVDALLKVIKEHNITREKQYQAWGSDVSVSYIDNPRWTADKLLELIELFREPPAILGTPTFSADVRRAAFKRLFGEHIYPSVINGTLLGSGLAERAVASLLNGDGDFLHDTDIELIARIDFDYDRKDVDISAALAAEPELHREVLSSRLRQKMNEIPDQPNPVLGKKRQSM
ncbi:TPA: hypothetical protein RQN23_003008 [Aeromonas veronii]|nr:hypothetical protein [Aeromonas veronii]